jgi:hypothetical protein
MKQLSPYSSVVQGRGKRRADIKRGQFLGVQSEPQADRCSGSTTPGGRVIRASLGSEPRPDRTYLTNTPDTQHLRIVSCLRREALRVILLMAALFSPARATRSYAKYVTDLPIGRDILPIIILMSKMRLFSVCAQVKRETPNDSSGRYPRGGQYGHLA